MDRLARPLFHSDRGKKTVRSDQLRRRPLRKEATHLGLPGICCVLLLIMMALTTIPLMLSDCALWEEGDATWSLNAKTKEELWRFFSNQPLRNMSTSLSWLDFHGKHILGWFGAMQISILAGILFGLCTYFCMFYDSSEPGSFPPSPMTPRKSKYSIPVSTEYALGYKMVPINTLIFIVISVVLLRLYFNLPFY